MAHKYCGVTGCAVEATLAVVGGRWKPVLLFHLLEGRKRFSDLCRAVPNATQRMITLQLRELEADGVVARHVFAQVPPRVEYSLTDIGRKFAPVLESIRAWGTDYIDYLHANRLMGSSPTAALSIWSIDPVLKKRPDLPGEMASRAFLGWFGASRGIRCSRLSHVFVGGAVGRGIPLLP